MNNVHQSLGDYVDDLDERGYPQSKEGRELGTRISPAYCPVIEAELMLS